MMNKLEGRVMIETIQDCRTSVSYSHVPLFKVRRELKHTTIHVTNGVAYYQ